MLETVKTEIRKTKPAFEKIYAKYMLKIQNINMQSELNYLICHNHLDILKLDKWIEHEFEAISKC